MNHEPQRPHRRSIRLQGYDYALAGAYFVTIVAQHRACLFGMIENGEVRPSPAGDMLRAVWESLPARFPHVALDGFVVMPNHVHGVVLIVDDVWAITPDPGVGAPLVGAWGDNAETMPRATTRVAPTDDGPVMPRATTRVAPTDNVSITPRTTTAEPDVGAPLVGAGGDNTDTMPRATTRVAPTDDGPVMPRATTRVAPTDRPTLGDVVGAWKSLTTVAYITGVRQDRWTPFAGRLWQRNYYEHIIRNDEDLAAIREYILTNPRNWALDAEFSA